MQVQRKKLTFKDFIYQTASNEKVSASFHYTRHFIISPRL